MKDSHRITHYSMDFDRITYQLSDWSDHPKVDAFYKGLAPRIKNFMASQATAHPHTLEALCDLVVIIDENYCEFKNDQGDSGRPSTNNSHSNNSTSTAKAKAPSTSNTSTTSKAPKAPSTTNPNAKLIGTNGKLLPTERERRDKEGACRYCGIKGHFVAECPTRPKDDSNARGRATFTISSEGKITEESSDESDTQENS